MSVHIAAGVNVVVIGQSIPLVWVLAKVGVVIMDLSDGKKLGSILRIA